MQPNLTTNPVNERSNFFSDNFFVKAGVRLGRITPRIAVAALTGFYILGYAYANGWMMAIDQIAIKVMRHYDMGYIAIGAIMPTIQWYAAWSVRLVAGLIAGLTYDFLERILMISFSFFTPDNAKESIKRAENNIEPIFV